MPTIEADYINKINDMSLSQAALEALQMQGVFALGDLLDLTLPQLAECFEYKIREEIKIALTNSGQWRQEQKPPSFDEQVILATKLGNQLEASELSGEDQAVEVYRSIGLVQKIRYLHLSERSERLLEARGISYIGDLIVQKEETLLKLPNLGKTSVNEIIMSLWELGLELGMKLKYWPIEEAGDIEKQYIKEIALSYESKLIECFFTSIALVTKPRDILILESRLGIYGKRQTLEELGATFDLTRERVRQIQKKLILRIIKNELWCEVLRVRLKNIMDNRSTPLFLDKLSDEDLWFDGFVGKYDLLETILSNFLPASDLQFLSHGERKIVTTLPEEDWVNIRYNLLNELEYNTDVGYTSDDIDLIVESKLELLGYPELSEAFLDVIATDLNFAFSGEDRVLIGVGNSASNRLKVLLEQSDEPVHYASLTKIYNQYYGITVSTRYIHSCLSNNGFLLFDRGTYGLQKHLRISLEKQSELREQMERFILDGKKSRQWHSKNLVEKFYNFEKELNIYTVNIILSESEQLRYLGRNSWKIKTSDADQDERVEIHTVIYKVLKKSGRPLSSQELQDLVAKERDIGDFFNVRATDLYSRVDESTWGLLDRDFAVTFEEQNIIKDFFYAHFIKEKIAATKGELVDILDVLLQKEVSSNHIFGVLTSDERFKAWHGGYVGLASWVKSGRKGLKETLKELVEQIQGEVSLNSILGTLKQQLGKDFSKGSVTVYLSKLGLEYNRNSGLWFKP